MGWSDLKQKRLLAKAIAGLARSPFVLTENISSSSACHAYVV